MESRQVEASPEQGINGVTPRYPWVGKTMEGVTPPEAKVRARRPRAPAPQSSNKEERKVASRP